MEIIVDRHQDLSDHLDDDMMESPSQGNMELSDGNSDVCEKENDDEVILYLDELVQKATNLSNLSINSSNEDDEEGAIKEDFVPFRRVSHDSLPSQNLHILNLPPEMDLLSLSNIFLGYSQLFKKASPFETNKIQVICHSVDIAKVTKDKLDGLLLLNREIQVVFAPRSDLANQAYPLNNLVVPPPPPTPQTQSNLMYGRGTTSYGPGAVLPPRSNSHHSGTGLPLPRVITSQFYKGGDRQYADAKKSRSFNIDNASPSQWAPDQSIIDRHTEFVNIYNKHGICQRYILLQDFNLALAKPNLETWIKETCGYPCPQVHFFADSDFVNGKLLDLDDSSKDLPERVTLHMCFTTKKQTVDIYRGLLDLNLDLSVQYTAPYLATNCLWIGNLTDILRQTHDPLQIKQALSKYGTIVHFKSMLDNNCIYVTYQDILSAIKARNQLFCASVSHPQQNVVINADFSTNLVHPGKGGTVAGQESNGDLEQRLISVLKSTPRGAKLLEEFLSGSSKYSSMNELLSNHFSSNNYNDEYRPYNANNRFRRDRHDEPRRYQTERRSEGDGDRYGMNRYDRFSRSTRDSYNNRSPQRKRQFHPDNDPLYPKRAKTFSILCQLLKRGKEICKVSAVFISGDSSLYIPKTLDVNQRAHPERLSSLLEKSNKFSLWQLGADTRQDSIQYDKLCDYLISKNRVALLQHENLQVYIVPPYEKYIELLKIPDAKFLYCYIIPGEASFAGDE